MTIQNTAEVRLSTESKGTGLSVSPNAMLGILLDRLGGTTVITDEECALATTNSGKFIVIKRTEAGLVVGLEENYGASDESGAKRV